MTWISATCSENRNVTFIIALIFFLFERFSTWPDHDPKGQPHPWGRLVTDLAESYEWVLGVLCALIWTNHITERWWVAGWLSAPEQCLGQGRAVITQEKGSCYQKTVESGSRQRKPSHGNFSMDSIWVQYGK